MSDKPIAAYPIERRWPYWLIAGYATNTYDTFRDRVSAGIALANFDGWMFDRRQVLLDFDREPAHVPGPPPETPKMVPPSKQPKAKRYPPKGRANVG